MSVGIYFECILIYSAIDIRVPKKKYFISHDINIAPRRAYEIVLLNISFYPKRDVAWDDESSGYSSLSPPNVIMNLYGSDFSGR